MFGISISGVINSQKYLDVTSNNIANANTIGFKRSRAEFADVYSSSVFTNSKTAVGMGSQATSVSQQFVQGNLSGDTGNNLDMAIQGNGFFVLSNQNNAPGGTNVSGDRTYTRAGAFQINNQGYIVTAQGDYLQGWDVNDNGDAAALDINSTHSIHIPEDTGAPRASSNIGIGVNLPASKDSVLPPTNGGFHDHPNVNNCENWDVAFDPEDSDTYTCSTSQTIHDSLGGAHTLTYYMLKMEDDPTNNTTTWNVITYLDGNPVDVANANGKNPIRMEVTDANSSVVGEVYYGFQMKFGPDGQMQEMVPSALFLSNDGVYKSPRDKTTEISAVYDTNGSLHSAMGGGVDPTQDVHLDFEATQYGSSSFTVNISPTNDGYSTGILVGVTVSEDGILQAEYTNGQYISIAKIAMADFANCQGLTKVGDTQWKQSLASGEPTPKEANRGGAGAIKGANLEESNVDLTTQLVDLIIGQRNYQANAQSLQTQNTVMDSILNIR